MTCLDSEKSDFSQNDNISSDKLEAREECRGVLVLLCLTCMRSVTYSG